MNDVGELRGDQRGFPSELRPVVDHGPTLDLRFRSRLPLPGKLDNQAPLSAGTFPKGVPGLLLSSIHPRLDLDDPSWHLHGCPSARVPRPVDLRIFDDGSLYVF